MTYPGGKNGAGVFQKIINLMPPHEVYIEPFLGNAAVMRAKRIEFLKSYSFTGCELVYCDPPYLMSARSGKRLYAWEWWVDQHRQLLRVAIALPCLVMISGYQSSLYTEMLQGWNSIQYEAMTRGGHTATEWLWYNFPTPVELHDYRYLGTGFRERERIKRKKQRWTERLKRMPALERQALLSAIADIGGSDEGGSASVGAQSGSDLAIGNQTNNSPSFFFPPASGPQVP